jgi:RNA recognition motif-containing protein
MKATLKALFKGYGNVLNVTAHHNLRMRGQAFVSFESKELSVKAQKEVNRFPLYGKPMVCCLKNLVVQLMRLDLQQISFARTRSDAVVKKLDSEHYDEHLKTRKEQKSGF